MSTIRNKKFLTLIIIVVITLIFFGATSIAFNIMTNPAAKSTHPPAPGEIVNFDSVPDKDGKTFKVYANWIPVEDSDWVLILIGGYRLNSNNPFMVEKEQIPLNQSGYSTLLLDLPDSGGLTIGDGHINFGTEEQLAIRAARKWLSDKGYTKIGFVTHSMGSYATLLAAAYDSEIKYIVADSPLTNLQQNIHYRIGKGQLFNIGYPLAFIHAGIFKGENFWDVDVDKLAISQDIRLLISVCNNDPAVDPNQGRELHKRFNNSKIVDGMEHQEIHPCYPYDHNEFWLEDVIQFFNQ